jgi:hypothetical protein
VGGKGRERKEGIERVSVSVRGRERKKERGARHGVFEYVRGREREINIGGI